MLNLLLKLVVGAAAVAIFACVAAGVVYVGVHLIGAVLAAGAVLLVVGATILFIQFVWNLLSPPKPYRPSPAPYRPSPAPQPAKQDKDDDFMDSDFMNTDVSAEELTRLLKGTGDKKDEIPF